MSKEEKEGIQAIIYLSSLAGKRESLSRARQGWITMTPVQKQATLDAYKIVKAIEKAKHG